MLTFFLPLFLVVGQKPMVLTIGDVLMTRHPTTSAPMEIAVFTIHQRYDATLVFDWDFGDDTTATTTSPSITHHYVTADTYFFRVVVTDTHNHLTAKLLRLITVAPPR